MKPLTREIITGLLNKEQAWDKNTRHLRYNWLIERYDICRQSLFYDKVFFPRMSRCFRLCHALGILPELSGFENDGVIYPWCEDSELYECIGEHFFSDQPIYYGRYWRPRYFTKLWYEGEYAYDMPGIDEVLELGIKPNLVPAKAVGASIQKSLF